MRKDVLKQKSNMKEVVKMKTKLNPIIPQTDEEMKLWGAFFSDLNDLEMFAENTAEDDELMFKVLTVKYPTWNENDLRHEILFWGD